MNSNNFSYSMPTKIIYGIDQVQSVGSCINHRRAILITSQGFFDRGLVDKVSAYADSIVGAISNVQSHPEFVDVEKLYQEAREYQFDLIIAMGGGSVIDVAKFISVCCENESYQFVEDLTKGKIKRKNCKSIPVVSIPTLAGTGSEITPYLTIWDMSERQKYSLSLTGLFPEAAIYDPILTLTTPRDITIQVGLDALSHSLESIWNRNANPITLDFAVKSAKLIIDNLVDLSADLGNISLRDNMMKASMYAGLAFSNTQTAIAHAISYYITSHKNIPHGIACSFTLPMLVDRVVGKHDFVDESLQEIFGELRSDKLRIFFNELGISTEFESYGVDDAELYLLKQSIRGSQRASNSLVFI